jgi:hypothetical protein
MLTPLFNLEEALARLDDPTVNADWGQMAWLVDHPESFPFVNDVPEIFGGVEQLLYPTLGESRINRY